MENTWGRSIALPFATMALATPVSAQTGTASVAAEVVMPSELAVSAAELLMTKSPGVFALRIPGAAEDTSIIVTARIPERTSGVLGFAGSPENVEALRQLIAQLASSASASADFYRLPAVADDGALTTHGVQLVLLSVEQSGLIVAVIAFD